MLKQPQIQSQTESILSATHNSQAKQQTHQMDKMKLDRLLRKTRSKEYMEANLMKYIRLIWLDKLLNTISLDKLCPVGLKKPAPLRSEVDMILSKFMSIVVDA